MIPIEDFLSRLQKVRRTGAKSWIACCSAHQDKNPSMTVSEGSDGRILAHCFSHQCGIDDIAAAVGLEVKDLMPENLGYHRMKPLRMGVNPKDAMCAVRDDMTSFLIWAKMVQRGEVLTGADTLEMAKAVGRIQMAIELTGGK
ncbi:MAG TPA: CHC2 zinc finger domain-containing protein [Anaerolineales bacterium]|nr:CHC2 zinc finger domain-containing protein [Anaerolineales bacterium]